MQTAEQAIVERIKLSRGTTEPEQSAPTENTEAVNVSEDAPVEEVIETEAQVDEEVTTETEEPAEEVTAAQATDEETDLFYYDIDGEEVSSTQLSEWKANGLMQADYTRKTQELSDSRKTLEDDVEAFKDKQSKFDSHIATLEAMINEETLTPEALAELREYEPEKYIDYTEKLTSRKKFVEKNKAVTPVKSVDMAKVSADLFANHPEWMVDGKNSKKFTEDTNLMTSYAESRGIGQNELSAFEARHFEIMLDAARYQSINKKNVAIEKKVRMAPVTTKPRAAAKGIQTDLDAAKKAFKSNPTDKNAVALRKLQQKFNSKG